MQNETTTAGKTATNRFDEMIQRINAERDAELAIVNKLQDEIRSERETLRMQREDHYRALGAIGDRLGELKEAMKGFEERKAEIKAKYREKKEEVVQEAEAWYREHPGENWLWRKVYHFFKSNPDVAAAILTEEGGEL